ncbi:MAG: hypothetical protein E5X80_28805 [Mesorhizobium sp.]|uniref:hypothetical protein n=1 Tax=Mesorhizobium sp. TaxID=1871066 RepID=UPI000FE8B232|nr:hypothetical protein [Mesorhizobium sp.]RWM08608.1 MAG: hypothetical protein EOR71_11945 [Mesorhizobium sp.]TIO48212.1 MAG: hypothetical protein E5X78_30160 [Mesorhizobium sp.]TIO56635.1 MAG: hypothetical protein E5X79_29790 [Mesorhizobium sp.]TJV58043.1 MAG: hypothetical protein E5X80_28805 [Mesorhizobium sp.]
MNWWIGFCWVLGSLCFAALDYRVRKLAGKRWLSDWPWRLAMYFAVGGGLFAAIGYAPIALYQFGEAIVGLYDRPPKPKILLAFVASAIAVILAIEILKVAGRTIREASRPLQGDRSMAAAWRVAVALLLFVTAVGLLLGGAYFLRAAKAG